MLLVNYTFYIIDFPGLILDQDEGLLQASDFIKEYEGIIFSFQSNQLLFIFICIPAISDPILNIEGDSSDISGFFLLVKTQF